MPMTAAISIGDSVQQALDAVFGFIPNLFAFLILLFVGWILARVLKRIVVAVLDRAGIDGAMRSSPAGPYVARLGPDASASRLLGAAVFWLIFLGAISLAVAALNISALTEVIAAIYAYLPNVIAAVLILVVAVMVAGAVGGLVTKMMGESSTAKVVASALPVLIMVVATFMILNQLQIAPEIVTITYAALLGSVALGMALAFGLGGRESAANLISGAYDKAQDETGPAQRQPSERFKREADTPAYTPPAPHRN